MKHAIRNSDELVLDGLREIRTTLEMEVAFISEFKSGRRVFRFVDSALREVAVRAGASDPLEDRFCQRVVDGRLPELMHDAMQFAEARSLPGAASWPIGAHLSVPIRFSDGRVYGAFGCFSRAPNHALGERDIATMRWFAGLTAKLLEKRVAEEIRTEELTARYIDVLNHERFISVYQPIFDVAAQRPVGYEALTRFLAEPAQGPDVWFNEAAEIGLQARLEFAAVHKALSALQRIPEDTYLSFNLSPATVLNGTLRESIERYPCERLILEVTEHASVSDYSCIATILEPLRRRGLRLAVDDAGAGFASFRHILELKPDIIKLDTSLIDRIDSDLGHRALAAALVRFAEETGSKIVAEGVETQAQLQVLRELGVHRAQGYLLGRPVPIENHTFGHHRRDAPPPDEPPRHAVAVGVESHASVGVHPPHYLAHLQERRPMGQPLEGGALHALEALQRRLAGGDLPPVGIPALRQESGVQG